MLSFQNDRYPYSNTCFSICSRSAKVRSLYLFVLEPKQQNILHQCQLWLFTPFRTLADVPGIESNFVSILVTAVVGFGSVVDGRGLWFR